MDNYQQKYLKYKGKYINLRKKINNQMAPIIPNPVSNISVVRPIPPTIPNPVPNTPVNM